MSDSELDLDDRELTKPPDKSIEALRSAAEPTKRRGNSEKDKAPKVSNADLFSLMTTYFNNKLSGIENNFSDTEPMHLKFVIFLQNKHQTFKTAISVEMKSGSDHSNPHPNVKISR
ncbi:Hypothetical predicted protein [Mytilus galloprovincialis]|uniref:Uncharacterized protein n=1 Tax=Mytilus galloprovincialis TaxID=29158 RepID=A0A8B6G4B5_MYTGA|nr:Hypothetical predicted protein [Mytilus galloprovincialis]